MSRRTLLALMLPTLLGGCQMMPDDARVLQEREHYQRALDQGRLIEARQYCAEHGAQPDWQDCDRELRRALTREIRRLDAQVQQAIVARQWGQAWATLEQAQARLPDNPRLTTLSERLGHSEWQHWQWLQLALLTGEADWLAGQQETLRELAAVTRFHAAEETARLQQRRQALAARLRKLAEDLATDTPPGSPDWPPLESALRASHRLVPDTPPHPLLEAAERLRANEARRHQERQQAQQQTLLQQAQEHLKRYTDSRSIEDLIQARQFLLQHAGSAPLRNEQRQVDLWSRQRLEHDLAEGDALYAQGQYQQAHDLWAPLSALAPEDEGLKTRLARTLRVLESLQQLRNRP